MELELVRLEEGIEQRLADRWAVDRRDIYVEGIGKPEVIDAASPVRPWAALKLLGVSSSELLRLVETGRLCRPGQRGHGRVAWRRDEIERARWQLEEER